MSTEALANGLHEGLGGLGRLLVAVSLREGREAGEVREDEGGQRFSYKPAGWLTT